MKTIKIKTKFLDCSQNEINKPVSKLDGSILEVINEYKYLESMITNDGRYTRDIKCRLHQARYTFHRMAVLLTSNNIHFKINENILKTCLEHNTL